MSPKIYVLMIMLTVVAAGCLSATTRDDGLSTTSSATENEPENVVNNYYYNTSYSSSNTTYITNNYYDVENESLPENFTEYNYTGVLKQVVKYSNEIGGSGWDMVFQDNLTYTFVKCDHVVRPYNMILNHKYNVTYHMEFGYPWAVAIEEI